MLTRNRKHLLLECVTALLGQTRPPSRIIVLDNASSDGTEDLMRASGLLDRADLAFVRSSVNTGGAGGYARLVELAREEEGADWLWLMDDDSEPRPDALERLLAAPEARSASTAVLCPRVEGPAGELELLHRGHVGRFMRALPAEAYRTGTAPSLGFASFVGFMVRGRVARAIGLPRAEFFLGCDDVEYSLRARTLGTIRLVPGSVVVHKLGMGGGSVTRRSRFWNRVLGLAYTSSSWEGFWKTLYGIRNFVWIRHRHRDVTPIAFAALVAAYVLKTLIYDPRPFRRIPWVLEYAWKGRQGDFSGPSPGEWAAMVAAKD